MTVGRLEGTLTRQYQIGDLVASLAHVTPGMRVDDVQALLDTAGHHAHFGLAHRLFGWHSDGTLIENEALRSCIDQRPDARLMVWVAVLIADWRLADAVETVLVDRDGHINADEFNAKSLREELGRRGHTSAQKVASNLLRYFETAGLLIARRRGTEIVGVDEAYSAARAARGLVTLVLERTLDLEGNTVPPSEAIDFAIERNAHRWLLLSPESFRAAASGAPADTEAVTPAPSGTSGDERDDLNESAWDRFKPKDDGDYVAHVRERRMVKSRTHEALLNSYAGWTAERGFTPASPHPIDLFLSRGVNTWLVEAKVVYAGNATNAVRAAIGQLLAYRHFIYPDASPTLVALFSESIGEAYVEFLTSLRVSAVWPSGTSWAGSETALLDGLAAVSN